MVCGLLCVISVLRSGAGADRIKKVFDRPWKKILQALLEMYGTFAMNVCSAVRYRTGCKVSGLVFFHFGFFLDASGHEVFYCISD